MGNRVDGAADTTSQEVVVSSAQRVVVAHARAPHYAAVQHCLEYLVSEHLEFELEGSARLVVRFESLLPKNAPCVACAPIDLDGQVGIVVNVPPRCTNLFIWLYTWPAASTLNMAVDSGIHFVHKHTISVLASDTVRLNAAHATTITPIISLGFSGDCETSPASSA